jgi:hypothetical protein
MRKRRFDGACREFLTNLPILALPKASLKIAFPGWGFCMCILLLGQFGSFSLFLLGCSTGSTRLRFFGSFERACLSEKEEHKAEEV